MINDDFVPPGSPSGWYRHPHANLDYFHTGAGFGTVNGEPIRRPHSDGAPEFEPASRESAAEWVRMHGVGAAVRRSMVVTTDTLPGFAIVRLLGLVSELTSASGWTASAKGNQALDRALDGLCESAAAVGGNAIVGFTAATFGAHGGITSGFGGDAVGILLTGTAVLAEPNVNTQAALRNSQPGDADA